MLGLGKRRGLDAAAGTVQDTACTVGRIGSTAAVMRSNRDSEVKARYALAVLRVAQSADRETAARLVQGLARDLPHPDERREIAALHFQAIDAFEKLADGLRVSATAPSSWKAATAATSKWLAVVERG
jgi:hypothetical protein